MPWPPGRYATSQAADAGRVRGADTGSRVPALPTIPCAMRTLSGGSTTMTVASGLAQAPSGRAAEGFMHAFVMSGLDQVGFMQKPIPRPGPLDAIVRTTRALICTSDAHTVHGAIGPRENLVLGHEAVGIVQEIGSEVRHVK